MLSMSRFANSVGSFMPFEKSPNGLGNSKLPNAVSADTEDVVLSDAFLVRTVSRETDFFAAARFAAAVRVMMVFFAGVFLFAAVALDADLRVETVFVLVAFREAAVFLVAAAFFLAVFLAGKEDFNLSRRRLMLDASLMPTALMAVVGFISGSLVKSCMIFARILSSSMPEPFGRPRVDFVAMIYLRYGRFSFTDNVDSPESVPVKNSITCVKLTHNRRHTA